MTASGTSATGGTTTYGDPDVLRRRVGQLREQAVDVRMLADQLVARTEATGWTGRAADTMRQRVGERAGHLRGVAAAHESAAECLETHLQEVERVTDAIAAIERRVTSLVADARTRLAAVARARDDGDPTSAVRVDPDPDDVLLDRFDAPPGGHRDWLAVDLPGVAQPDSESGTP